MKKAALLFDLDGTLVDSVPDLARILSALVAEYGAARFAPAEVAPMVGDGVAPLVRRGLAARGLPPDDNGELVARYLALYEAAPALLTRPYPGVPETLARLRSEGWPLGIVTNKAERVTRLVLETLGLAPFFPVVVGGDTTPWKKPDRRPLLAALAALGAAEGIFVGDSENDAAAAHEAGLPCLLLRYGYARRPIETLGAAALLERFDELPAALRALAG